MTESLTLAQFKQSEAAMAAEEAGRGVKIHASVYVLVNIVLATVNLVFVPQSSGSRSPWSAGASAWRCTT